MIARSGRAPCSSSTWRARSNHSRASSKRLVSAHDSDLCAACVPTQPNWAELRHAQCDNDGEKLATQRASAALSEPEPHSTEISLASFVIRSDPLVENQ
jgi:hypothetical protein